MKSVRYFYIVPLLFFWYVVEITESSENLARNKHTSQSTGWDSNPSSYAVDGFTNCSMGFTHTGEFQQFAWWQVDLGNVCEIKTIQMYYRKYYDKHGSFLHFQRLNGYSINITRSLNPLQTWQCFKDRNTTVLPSSASPSHICRRLGRYVSMSVERLPGVEYTDYDGKGAVIHLCEFEVYGCPVGRYGKGNCVSECSVGCLQSRCDPDDGNCTCTNGWKGEKCDVQGCKKGFYGENCSSCSTGCTDNACDPGNGVCISGCNPSFYGDFCNLSCSDNCYKSLCKRDRGACIGCKSGFYGTNCNSNCQGKCKDKCEQDSGNCIECVIPFQGNRCTDYGPGNTIRIVPAITKYTFTENTTVKDPIRCYADCIPNCTYRWNSTDNPLIFGKIDRNKAGTYVCIAANAFGSSQISIQLFVQYPARIIDIRTSGNNSTVMEKQSFVIECVMDGVPAPVAGWTKDNGTKFPVANIPINPSQLIINRAHCLDTGNYTCTADNRITDKSKDSKSLEINVLCAPTLDYRIRQSAATKVFPKSGEELNISVQYLAYPVAKVKWTLLNSITLKHDLIVDSEDGYKIINKDFKYWQISTLTKSRMTKVDFGTYIVELVNTVSSASSVFIVEESQMISEDTDARMIFGLASCGLIILVIAIVLAFVLLRKGYSCNRLPDQRDSPVQHTQRYEDLTTGTTTSNVYNELSAYEVIQNNSSRSEKKTYENLKIDSETNENQEMQHSEYEDVQDSFSRREKKTYENLKMRDEAYENHEIQHSGICEIALKDINTTLSK